MPVILAAAAAAAAAAALGFEISYPFNQMLIRIKMSVFLFSFFLRLSLRTENQGLIVTSLVLEIMKR